MAGDARSGSRPRRRRLGKTSPQDGAVVLLGVIALHLVLYMLLRGAPAQRDPLPTSTRVTLRLIAPVPPPRLAEAPAAPAAVAAPLRPRGAPAKPERRLTASTPANADAPIALPAPEAGLRAGVPASAPPHEASLLDGEATRRAIRASAREPSLTEQLARARDEPDRAGAQQRLADGVRSAGTGDCLKGEFAGAGMGLLSLPFLAVAAASGKCTK